MKIIKIGFLFLFLFSLFAFFVNGEDVFSDEESDITVISFNETFMYSPGNRMQLSNYDEIVNRHFQYLKVYSPDVLILQEHEQLDSTKVDHFIRENIGLNYYAFFPYGKQSDYAIDGMAIYSRFPIKNYKNFQLEPLQGYRSLGVALLDYKGRELVVGGFHFPKYDQPAYGLSSSFLLKEFFAESPRSIQASNIIEISKIYRNKPVVLAGDLNTIPMTKGWRIMASEFRDTFNLYDSIISGTRETPLGLEVKVDYIFVSDEIGVASSYVGDMQGSHHRPVIAELRL